MYGVMVWREPVKGPLIQRWRLGPIWVQGVWIQRTERTPNWLVRRRVAQGVRWLNQQGIHQGVCPPDMEGLEPVSTVALRQGLAMVCLERCLQEKGLPPQQATVGLVAERITPQVMRVIEGLVLCHRHLCLQMPQGEQMCEALRRLYGVAVQCNLGAEALENCDGVVAFAPMDGVHPDVVTYQEAQPMPPLQWPAQWTCPPEVSPLQAWAMVASTETWKEEWVKLALVTEF
ncbi:hypothetical protein RFF05_05840 [Bengtsoniella intestinalis]|uniref:hypothetical protein n=1 Tax=Bengtsoniella intestinalis TaxID=3073143 RepID=UPI00391EE912